MFQGILSGAWVRVAWAVMTATLVLASIGNPSAATSQPTRPSAPTGLTAAPVGSSEILLTWDDPSDATITGYEYAFGAEVKQLTAGDAANGDSLGESVALDGDTMVVGAPADDSYRGAAYVYAKGSGVWTQVAKLTASDAAADDWFGESVAIDGDIIAVGAYRDDDGGSGSGSVYVFNKPTGGWATASGNVKLTASDATAGDEFGRSIAIDDDTVFIGASKDDDGGSNSGSVYVFTKPAGGWASASSDVKLTASDAAANDNFGASAAIDGDTIVIGANGDDDGGSSSGSVYLFTRPSGGWASASSNVKLTASDAAANDNFGGPVGIAGDTIVIGASKDDDGGANSGSVYVFTKPAAGWTAASSDVKLTASDAAAADRFGGSVAIDGDTIAVGASQDDDGDGRSGSVYVFSKPVQGWVTASEDVKLVASDAAVADNFGESVAIDGGTVVIGTPGDDDAEFAAGSASVFHASGWTVIAASAAGEANATSHTVSGLINGVEHDFRIRARNGVGASKPSAVTTAAPVSVPVPARSTGLTAAAASSGEVVLNWSNPSNRTVTGHEYEYRAQIAKLTATDAASGHEFGRWIAVDGDTMVVGANNADSNGGAAYVYGRQSGGWRQVAKLTAAGTAAGDRLGGPVAIDGDTIVAAGTWNNAGRPSASVYVFSKPVGGWATASSNIKLTAADAAVNDLFGFSVALDGDTAVVGAPRDDDGASNSGSVYVFSKPVGGWATASSNIKLTAADAGAGDQLGWSVAAQGGTVAIGAYSDENDGARSGSVYVFSKPVDGWASASGNTKLTAADGAAGDYFGWSVDVDGDTIAVGAYGDDDDGSRSGSAYVFSKPASGWTTTSGDVKLTASDAYTFDYFGVSVAVSGDTIAVGASRDSYGGSVYLFNKPASGWASASDNVKLIASDPIVSDSLGSTVAIDGGTIVAGAPSDDDAGRSSGSAYVFHASGWTGIAESAHRGPNETSHSIAGLVNGTRYGFRVRAHNRSGAGTPSVTATAVPGVPKQPTGLSATPASTGGARLRWDAPTDTTITGYEIEFQAETAKLTASDATVRHYFGNSVALDDDTMVVGAPHNDMGGGAAYVYVRRSGEWAQVAKLTAGDAAAGDLFGQSVAIDGDTVVVGAPGDDDGGSNSGSAYVFSKPAGGWLSASSAIKLTAADATADDYFGAKVAIDGSTIVVGAPWSGEDATGWGSTYVFSKPAGGWATANGDVKLTAAHSFFFAVALAIDGDTIAVGGELDGIANNTGWPLGAVYVFSKPAGGWASASGDVRLTASDAGYDDRFGGSVAIDGDTIVVGAPRDDDGGSDAGSAYVFAKPAGGWATGVENAKLTASDPGVRDYFGGSVAIDGDTIIIGAGSDDTRVQNTGSAYLFTKPADGWVSASRNAKLIASDASAGDGFGRSMSIDGDTIVIGASGDDGVGRDSNSGSVYVFHAFGSTAIADSAPGEANATSHTVTGLIGGVEYDFRVRARNAVGASEPSASATATPVPPPPAQPTGLTATAGDGQVALSWADPADTTITGYEYELRAEVAELAASDGASRDRFGESAAVDGDVLVVGAPSDDSRQGAAYVFVRRSGAWSQAAKLTAANRRTGDQFGVSVAIDGNTIVVGSYGDDAGGTGSGVAHVFVKPATGWATATSSIKLTATDAVAADLFGHSVAIDGGTIVVGSYGDDDGGTDAGAAYVFAKPATGWATATSSIKLTASDAGAGDNLGRSVAIDGDTIVAGAYGDDDGGTDAGAAYVFAKPATGWATSTQTAKLTASSPAAGDLLGWSVAIDGGTVVVGAYGDDDGGAIAGAAYVFAKPATGWATATSSAKLTASDATANDWFGWSIAIDGDTVAVGSLWDDDVAIASGSVYTFAKPAAGWAAGTETAKLTVSSPAAGDLFGYSVAIDGSTVAVGAVFDDGAGQDSGSAYVYELSGWTAVADSAPGEANASSYTLTGLINDLDYSVRIRAVNRTGASTPSAAVAFTPESACVTAPENVTTPICAAVSGNELTLTFNRGLAAIDAAAASALRFAFLIDGAFHNGAPVTNQSPKLVAVDGAALTLTLGTAIRAGDEVSVRYFASATDNGLAGIDGTAVADFTATFTTTQRD